jgi:hypothetical protein
MAKILVLANPLLFFYGSFLDRGARLSRRPGFLFYVWLRHVQKGPEGPKGVFERVEGGYRENPESEWVEGRC